MTSESLRQPSLYLAAANRECVKESYANETFYIEECDVGLGVFANRDIGPGEFILAFGGPLIDFAETKRRGRWECMPLQIGPNEYYDTQPPGIFVNHSCSPNAGIRHDRDLIALRDIRKGEEIRFDYSTSMEEQSFTMHCLCGAPNCRHRITDFSTLPGAVQKEYLAQGIVMRFIAEKFQDQCGVRNGECGTGSAERGVRSAERGVRSADSFVPLSLHSALRIPNSEFREPIAKPGNCHKRTQRSQRNPSESPSLCVLCDLLWLILKSPPEFRIPKKALYLTKFTY